MQAVALADAVAEEAAAASAPRRGGGSRGRRSASSRRLRTGGCRAGWVASRRRWSRSGAGPRGATMPPSESRSKCWRWRGRSSWNQAEPKRRRCQLPKLGTAIVSRPPGRSRRAAWASASVGSSMCSSEWLKMIASKLPVCPRGVGEGADDDVDAGGAGVRRRPARRARSRQACQPWRAKTAARSPMPQPTSRRRPGGRSPDVCGRARSEPRLAAAGRRSVRPARRWAPVFGS